MPVQEEFEKWFWREFPHGEDNYHLLQMGYVAGYDARGDAAQQVAETDSNDLLELAWGIIANAGDWLVVADGTPCSQRAQTWREAAARWRDRYHARAVRAA